MDVKTAKAAILTESCKPLVIDEIRRAGVYRELGQAFAVLTPVQSVGVMGDDRTYANLVAIRAVTSGDFMTADWARLSPELLARISHRIVNEVPGINRVVYDITSKPPATMMSENSSGQWKARATPARF